MVEMASIKGARIRFHNYLTSQCGLVRKNLSEQFSNGKIQSPNKIKMVRVVDRKIKKKEREHISSYFRGIRIRRGLYEKRST
jgi:hypothetical protein